MPSSEGLKSSILVPEYVLPSFKCKLTGLRLTAHVNNYNSNCLPVLRPVSLPLLSDLGFHH